MATGRTLSAWTSESESSQVGFWFHRFVDLKQQLLDGCFMSTFRIRTCLQTQQACGARAHTHSPSSLRQRCLAVSSDPVSTSWGGQPFWTSARGEHTCRTTSCLLISPLNDLNRCWAQISELWKSSSLPRKSNPSLRGHQQQRLNGFHRYCGNILLRVSAPEHTHTKMLPSQ